MRVAGAALIGSLYCLLDKPHGMLCRYRLPLQRGLAISILLAGCGGGSGSVITAGTAASTTLAAPAPGVTTDSPPAATPFLTEGPYYPLDKPADRDNNLVEGATGFASGQALAIDGLLLWEDGSPVEGAVVEIWQTDNQGIYLHPNDRDLVLRDQNFQSYGESITDAAGRWDFLTIVPGVYEGRPRHIHLKVRIGGEEKLTSQFVFAGDPQLANDGVLRGLTQAELDAITLDPNSAGEGIPRQAQSVIVLAR